MKNSKGQFVLEAILLMIVFLGLITLITGYFNKQGFLEQLVKTPWTRLSGMLQNGEWMTPDKSNVLHPSQHSRHVTIEGLKP
jgi:hypothetical protein